MTFPERRHNEGRPRTPGWLRTWVIVALAAAPLAAYEEQIRTESRYLAGEIAGRGKTAVAVVDFTDLDGAVTHLGRFMAEEMSVAIAKEARSFRVVDRTHILSLLKEHKLAASGLIDPDTARELGRIVGVDTLVTGTITPLGDSVRLSIKAIDSENAQVIASTSCDISKTQAIESLQRRGVASTGGGGSVPGSMTVSSPTSPTVERQGIIFSLQGCQRSGETIICYLVITNQAQDRNLELRTDSTRIFDHFGNEFYASQVRLGSANDYNRVWRDLVRNIPINASAVFEGLAPEVQRVTLVEFDLREFTIQFKDVPIG